MLNVVGARSLDALVDDIIPAAIRTRASLALPEAMTEFEYFRDLRRVAAGNQVWPIGRAHV